LNGKEYQLDLNTGSKMQNHIHGGFQGFHDQLWTAEEVYEGVKLTYHAKDGEGGYPGNMTVSVLYSLSNDNELSISYEATCDQDTICNLTNHTYFNLDGFESPSILDQKIQLFADTYTWADEESLPDGRILEVAGTPMDLRQPTRIGEHIDDDFDELQMGKGYDHNWIIRDEKPVVEMKPGMFGYDPHCPLDYLKGGLKKAAYAEYRKLRDVAQELSVAVRNIASLYEAELQEQQKIKEENFFISEKVKIILM
jgi:aldose 1-epimerase